MSEENKICENCGGVKNGKPAMENIGTLGCICGLRMPASENRYIIETFSDFTKVPVDRLDTCLEEFATFIHVYKRMQIEAEKDGNGLITMRRFQWIDDGKQDAIVNFQVEISGNSDAINEKAERER